MRQPFCRKGRVVCTLEKPSRVLVKNLDGVLTNPIDLHLTCTLGILAWEPIQLNGSMHRPRRQCLLLLGPEELLAVHITHDVVRRPLHSIVVPLRHVNVGIAFHLLIILAVVQEELEVFPLRVADLGVVNLATDGPVFLVGPEEQDLVIGGRAGGVARARLPAAVLLADVPGDAAGGAVGGAADGEDAVREGDGRGGTTTVAGVAGPVVDAPVFGEGGAVELVLVGGVVPAKGGGGGGAFVAAEEGYCEGGGCEEES